MVNRFLFAVLMVGIGVTGYSQGKLSIENVHASHLRNSGAIIENGQIKGYFFLYQTDRVDRKKNEYTLQILDQNVNKVIDVKFEDTRRLNLLEAAYNTSTLAFLFKNDDTKTLDLKIYSIDGSLKYTYSRSFDRKTAERLKRNHSSLTYGASNRNIFDMGEKGYASVYPAYGGKQISYEVDFYSSQTKQSWTYAPAISAEKYTSAEYLGSSDSLIILKALKRNGKTVEPLIIAINLITRQKAFEIDSKNDEYIVLPTNVITMKERGKMLLTGNYYTKGNEHSKGIASYEIDSRGNVLSKKYNAWSMNLPSSIGYLQIQNVIQSNEKLFAVGQGAKGDMVIMEFNRKYNLTSATVYSRKFDYRFTSGDSDNSNFTVCYSDYVKSSVYKRQTFNSIRYNGDRFVTDKIELKSRANKLLVMPAKMGAVMIVEYFKKTKKMELRIQRMG
jgi:hypothetical protein